MALLRHKNKKRESKKFEFKPFSRKQLKLLNWWRKGSKYENHDIVIADGAIRSGKTISMLCSFLQFTQTKFDGETFIIAGKTIGSLKKNVIEPMKQILNAWGWKFEYNRSENYLIIGSNTYYMYDANNEASQDKLQGLIPEYTDIIECKEGVNWTSSLFLLSSDYAIVVVTTEELSKFLLE